MAKILIASFTYPPQKNGVSEAARTMAEGFAGCGHDVTVATSSVPGRNVPALEEFCGIEEFQISSLESEDPLNQKEMGRFRAFLQNEEWDIVYFHSWRPWPARLGLPVLKHSNARLVLVNHGFTFPEIYWNNKFPWGLFRWFRALHRDVVSMFLNLRSFDAKVSLSHRANLDSFIQNTMARILRHPGMHVIPNGIKTESGEIPPPAFRKFLNIGEESFLFICVANYCSRKDQIFAARAFLRADLPDSHLVFIGSKFNRWSDQFRREQQEFIKKISNGKIHWLENISRPMTLAGIAASNAAILSAKSEGQPIFLLEAMAAGRPWIARQAGCIADMEGGICVSSEKQMAEAIKLLSTSPTLAKSLGEEGRAAVEVLYNQNACIAAYEHLTDYLIEGQLSEPVHSETHLPSIA